MGSASTPDLGLQEAPLDGYLAQGEKDPRDVAAFFAEDMRGMGANADGIVYLHAGLNPFQYIAAARQSYKAKNDYNALAKLLDTADAGNLFAMSSVAFSEKTRRLRILQGT